MFSTSFIELSESALRKNIRFLKQRIGAQTAFCSVVKGNAYGHGIETFVPLAEKCGIRRFAVFSADEALRVLSCRTKKSSIMIMGALDNEEIPWAIENDISFYIFDLDRLEATRDFVRILKRPAKIHLELETGFNRMGLGGVHLEKAVEIIKNTEEYIIVEGVNTHFAGAESSSNYLRIQNQIKSYHNQCEWLKQKGITPKKYHTACSAAALTYPETVMDLVRFGIAQYGYWPTIETKMHYFLEQGADINHRLVDPLKRVMAWKSKIMNIKTVEAGEFVGYGTSYMTSKREKIAAAPVGYIHGFSRNLSNLGRVLIHGKRASVVGLVNMNMMLVKVTEIPSVKKGDEVVLIGKQKKLQITVASFSDLANNLNYEVLVSLPSEIPRIVVE